MLFSSTTSFKHSRQSKVYHYLIVRSLPGAILFSETSKDFRMQLSTFTWIITAMLAGHTIAMPRGGGNAGANSGDANANANSNGKLGHVSKSLGCQSCTNKGSKKAAAAGASTDGQTCEGGTGNIIDTGVCKNGKCNIEIPPNELSIVASADCE